MKPQRYNLRKKNLFAFRAATIALALVSLFLLGSCVGQKKYDEALNSVAELKKEKKADSIRFADKMANKNKVIESQLYSLGKQNQLINEKAARLDSLESVLEAEKKYLSNVRKVIDGLKTENWEVEQLNGMLLIELDDDILFGTGSTKISKAGISLIQDISRAVKGGIDDKVKIWIAGHTDDKLYTTGNFDNWDLSAQRALAVVREMEKSKLDSWKLTALARSMYSPQVPNRSSALRSKNRRTEIYLIPENNQNYNNIEKLISNPK